MFYWAAIMTIVLYLISLIKAIRNKQEKDYRIGYIIYTTTIVFILIDMVFAYKPELEKQNYIQTLETKLNTYEQRYENYCVEDSIKQEELYE